MAEKKRTRNLQKVADAFVERLFGIPLSQAHAEHICIDCKRKIDMAEWSEFDKKEYEISGLCKDCQEKLYKEVAPYYLKMLE